MKKATGDFLEALALTLDTAVEQAMSGISGGVVPRSSAQPLREFAVLRRALSSDSDLKAFDRVIRHTLATMLHGIGVTLDGGTRLSDSHEVRLTLDGEELDPGLNELVIDYLDQTGRAPLGG